jgi:hypothetical protein
MEASNREAAGAGSAALVAEDRGAGGESEGPRLPPLLSSRPLPLQVVQAGLVPAAFGAICGWVLGVNKVAYLVLVIPVAILGGFAAGFEHEERRTAAIRGLVGGALFGGSILIVHELLDKEAKVKLPHPAFQLAVFTAVIGAALGSYGSRVRAEAASGERYADFSRLSPGELVGMASALVLLGSLWLPWFATSDSNRHSSIASAKIGFGQTATAWQTFPVLRWLLIAACTAPFILSWIIAREHALTWRPGEVTMIVGITAFVLILCNGVILGKPDPGIAISIGVGYFVGLLGCVGMMVAGYLRQAVYTDARKPPGVL